MEISFVFRSQSNTSEKPAVSRNRKLNSLRSFRSNAGFQPSLTSAAHKTYFRFLYIRINREADFYGYRIACVE